ncbi:MAG TPA: acyl-CoA dehydrogenase family protein [Acidimicrobiia bacterium]
MTAGTVVSQILDSADRLARIAGETATAAEAQRRVEPGFIKELTGSGLAAYSLPIAYGGHGGDVATLLEAVRRIGVADGSAAWVTMIYSTASLAAHYLDDAAVKKVFTSGPATISSGVLAPRGVAVRAGHEFVLSGRWPFASGCLDAEWISLGAMVDDPEVPGRLLNFYLPMESVEIVDTWDVVGLRATGSHDVVVREQVVPPALAFDLTETPRTEDPIARFPIYGLLAACIGAVTLGIARAAVDVALELGGAKVPTGSRRRLVDRPAFQEAVARSEAELEAATRLLFGRAGAQTGRASIEDRARLRMAATYAVDSAAAVVDRMYRAAGGTSIYSGSPLQRQLRDVHTATQHMMVAQPTWELTGRVIAGIDTDISGL